ncbi:MAG: flippase-like domain-containing protein [Chloroflexota bacterium]|nr:flippase-like domain-containing protein [Chloroflexota bacterium]
MKNTRTWLVISLSISIVTIILVIGFTATEGILDSLAKIRVEYLLVAVALRILAWLAFANRLRVMSNLLGGHITLLESTKIILCSVFVAGITPSYLGGGPLRIYMLKNKGLSVGDATAVDIGGRALDGLVLVALFPLAWFIIGDAVSADVTLSWVLIAIGIVLCIGLGIVLYGLIRPELTKSILEHLAQYMIIKKVTFGKVQSIVNRINLEIDDFRSGLLVFVREGRIGLPIAFFSTVAYWLCLFAIGPVILLGLNTDPIWFSAMAAQLVLMLMASIPLAPGGSGIAELSAISLYSRLLPTTSLETIGVFVVIWRCLTYYANLFVGGIASINTLRNVESDDILQEEESG